MFFRNFFRRLLRREVIFGGIVYDYNLEGARRALKNEQLRARRYASSGAVKYLEMEPHSLIYFGGVSADSEVPYVVSGHVRAATHARALERLEEAARGRFKIIGVTFHELFYPLVEEFSEDHYDL